MFIIPVITWDENYHESFHQGTPPTPPRAHSLTFLSTLSQCCEQFSAVLLQENLVCKQSSNVPIIVSLDFGRHDVSVILSGLVFRASPLKVWILKLLTFFVFVWFVTQIKCLDGFLTFACSFTLIKNKVIWNSPVLSHFVPMKFVAVWRHLGAAIGKCTLTLSQRQATP